ncbi:MAG: MYXO-CTERM sorting domain-containing protein [Deltaproteobacteria bacterium]|nr:MYXO-CTERM sorting domain-containing protein [Deltaproteobacteria bacterium]
MTFSRLFWPRLLTGKLLLTSLLMLPCAAFSSPVAKGANELQGLPTAPQLAETKDLGASFQEALLSAVGRRIDPELQGADKLKINLHAIGAQQVVRVTPYLNGVEVEGADRILTYRDGSAQSWSRSSAALLEQHQFSKSAEHALLTAHQATPGSLFKDPTVERVNGFAKKVYLAQGKTLRPAWRVRVPTFHLRDLSDLWIDAQTGELLRRQRVALFADGGVLDGGSLDAGVTLDSGVSDAGANDAGETLDASVIVDAGAADAGLPVETDAGALPAAPTRARVFQWAPPGTGVDPTLLVEVDLPMLRPAEVGSPLRGTLVETFNCCKEYVCLDGSQECEIDGRRCADDDDEFSIESTLALEVPADILPVAFPSDTIFARTVFCSELPRVRSRPADGDRPAGFFESPVDSTREANELLGLASEQDTFSEVQVYYTTMQIFLHMRAILDDDTWCLGGDSMQCETDGTPTLDENGEPVRAFHVATNVLIPEFDFNTLGTQIFTGAGQDPGNPVIIDDYQRMDNAAFIPALSGSPLEVPPELTALLEVFNRPYDSNVYFQGNRDFAYDGSIVFHEFVHAVVHSFVPSLHSLGKDQYGGQAEGGGLNEGWADYFSASLRNESTMGAYGALGLDVGELSLRNSENTKSCPNDITGEVHDDSEPWAGALWDIRKAVIAAHGESEVIVLDRAVLLSLAQADDDETMERAAERVMTNVETAFDAATKTAAEDAFNAHGILGCVRVVTMVQLGDDGEMQRGTKDFLHIPGPGDISVANLGVAPLQFAIEVPPTATGFALEWAQSTGGLAGQFTGQGEVPVLNVLVVEEEGAVEWRYEGADERTATPYYSNGDAVVFDPADDATKAEYEASNGSFTFYFEPDECAARRFIVQFISAATSTITTGISATVFVNDQLNCGGVEPGDGGTGTGTDEPEPELPDGCGCATSIGDADTSPPQPGFLAVLLLVGAGLSRRRREKEV